jgi:hypothetical protein
MSLFQKIEPGDWDHGYKYTAPSDGFILGIAEPPESTANYITVGYAWCQGVYAYVTGGSAAMFDANWNSGRGPNAQSLMLPVFAGDVFYIGIEHMTTAHATTGFWWISGTGQQVGAHARSSDADDSEFTPPPRPAANPGKPGNAEAFAAILERALGKPLAPDVKKDLLALGPIL